MILTIHLWMGIVVVEQGDPMRRIMDADEVAGLAFGADENLEHDRISLSMNPV